MKRCCIGWGLAVVLVTFVHRAQAQTPTELPPDPGSSAFLDDFFRSAPAEKVPVPAMFGDFIAPTLASEPYLVWFDRPGIPRNINLGSYKIANNESPLPQDRVYVNYNYFQQTTRYHIVAHTHVETLGVEKTFLEGAFSLGARLPAMQTHYEMGSDESEVGDLSLVLKALVGRLEVAENQPVTFSAGVMLTLPTSEQEFIGWNAMHHPVIAQPFVGALYTTTNHWFFQGFASVAAPTTDDLNTNLFVDLSAGYWIFQDPDAPVFRGLAPMAELHLTTPLNRRDVGYTNVYDIVTFVGGATLPLAYGFELGAGVSVPLTGPQPYDIQANLRTTFRW